MGCDIHFYVERRVNGRWVTADKWTPNKYASEEDSNEPKFEIEYGNQFYTGRNYDLFAILANVRNGRGFAGIKTGEGFDPISEPRGIPEDCCPEYRSAAEYYGVDGHSHSYQTVAELLAYNWTQKTRHQGYVTPDQWALWKNDGKPKDWRGGVCGGSVRVVPESEMALAVKRTGVEIYDLAYPGRGKQKESVAAVNDQVGGSAYCLVDWVEPYYKSVGDFLSNCMPRLWSLGAPEDVRIVYFFDN